MNVTTRVISCTGRDPTRVLTEFSYLNPQRIKLRCTGNDSINQAARFAVIDALKAHTDLLILEDDVTANHEALRAGMRAGSINPGITMLFAIDTPDRLDELYGPVADLIRAGKPFPLRAVKPPDPKRLFGGQAVYVPMAYLPTVLEILEARKAWALDTVLSRAYRKGILRVWVMVPHPVQHLNDTSTQPPDGREHEVERGRRISMSHHLLQ